MQAYWPPLLAAALVFAVFCVAAALWQRRRVAQLHRRLAEAEHSRLEAEDEARSLRRRLDVATRPPEHDRDVRRGALERALSPNPPPAVDPWVDTQPLTMTRGPEVFAPTQPMTELPPR